MCRVSRACQTGISRRDRPIHYDLTSPAGSPRGLVAPAPSVTERPESDDVSDELERPREALDAAVAAVPGDDLSESLREVAEYVPLAASVDFVNIRITGSDHRLHLVAASGCTAAEIRKRAFQPLGIAHVREMVADGGHEALARSCAIRWISVFWIGPSGNEVGTFAVGARTRRRPGQDEVDLLDDVARRLEPRLAETDRRAASLRSCSVRLARRWAPVDWPAEGPVARLRPREQTILELYADGLSTSDIAELLVISPHTVRTHVKLALRRMGVHTRDEAAQLVRADQLAQLV